MSARLELRCVVSPNVHHLSGNISKLPLCHKATGTQPLNTGPKEPQPPQHDPIVSDATIDQIPPALAKVQAPFEPFVLTLDTLNTNQQALDSDSFPRDKQFKELFIKSLYPSGPVRAEEVRGTDVQWPEGYRNVMKTVESVGKLKLFKGVTGSGKTELFVEAFDVDGERLVGVNFEQQS